MDGLELYQRIRQIWPNMVGVIVTAFAANNVMDEAKAMGLRMILPKPVDFEELLPLVEEIVGSAALEHLPNILQINESETIPQLPVGGVVHDVVFASAGGVLTSVRSSPCFSISR